jgi:hypothetical protein
MDHDTSHKEGRQGLAVKQLAEHDCQGKIIAGAKIWLSGGAANSLEQTEHDNNVLCAADS